MTHPGGGGNDINLAALWIPVMPETSHMGEEMRRTGQEAKRRFEEGFNSGTSPESMGQGFGARFSASVSNSLRGFELPFGLGGAVEKMSGDIDTKLINKLKGEASDALRTYRTEYENLTAAQTRAAEAESRVSAARDSGINKASVMIPLMHEQTTAQNALNAQLPTTAAAYEAYSGKVSKLSDVTKEASASSATMAGVMGGLVVAAAQQLTGAVESVVEHIIEGAVEAFKMGAEGAKEFADKMIELGETYHQIGVQVTEFSGASGAAFEELESTATRVFGSLDVAGKDTGKTLAQFSTILNTSGESVADLTKHFEELQGRYTDMRSTDLASIFVAFKTPAEEADSALASLLQSARNSGQDLGQLQSALAGDVSYTLKEAGLNLDQAGAFTGKLLEMGTPGRSVVMGLNTAMKDFGQEGLSFSQGMKEAGQRLKELGDTAEGQDLAEKLFGTRRWAVAKQAVQEYLQIVEAGPDAFNSNGDAIDDFIERTRTLQNEWEIVKHKAEEAFLPMGEAAVKLAGQGLDALVGYVNTHMDQIKHAVIQGGLEIIQMARDIQVFAEGLLTFFAPITDAVVNLLYGAIEGMSGFGKAAGSILAFIPGFEDIGKGMQLSSDAAGKMGDQLKNLQIGDKMRDLAQWSKDHPIDVDKASDSWIHFAEHVSDSMDKATSSVDKSKDWFGGAAGTGVPGVNAPANFSIGGAAGPGTILAGPGAGGPLVGGAAGAATGLSGSREANKSLAKNMFTEFFPASEWPAYEQLEMKEAGFDSTARNPKSGAFGIGQFYGHEHDKYAAGYSTNPVLQLRTQFQYIKDTYGTPSAAWAQYYNHAGGEGSYQTGGPVSPDPMDWLAGHAMSPITGQFNPNMQIDTSGTTMLPQLGDPRDNISRERLIGGAGAGRTIRSELLPKDIFNWMKYESMVRKPLVGYVGYQTGGVVGGDWWGKGKDPDPNVRYYIPMGMGLGANPDYRRDYIPGMPGQLGRGIAGGAGNFNPNMQIDTSRVGFGSRDLTGGQQLWDQLAANTQMAGERNMLSPIPGVNRAWAQLFAHLPRFQHGGPSGTDTVPAWLTPGEYVWDTGTVDKFGWLISALHGASKRMAGGGPVDKAAGTDPQIQFINQIAEGFGLQLTSGQRNEAGSYHASGEAGDFSNGDKTDAELAFAAYLYEHFGGQLAELIHDDPRWAHNVKDGRDVGAFGNVYTMAQAGYHGDHVHVAIKASQPISDQSPGNESLSAGLPSAPGYDPTGATPGGKNSAAFTGIPGQYGGGGAYGGQTADEAASTAEAVKNAKDRASDMDYEIGQKQKHIDDLKAEIAAVGTDPSKGKTGALGHPLVADPTKAAADAKADADKRKSLNDELDRATHDLTVAQRERGDQDTKIADATRKQTESYYKKPTSTGTKPDKVGKAVGTEEFSQLGGAFLSGVGQELGFGDLFGKPPWEWGAVKLLTGAANWAMGTANAWADQIGQGKTGIGGPGWGGNTGVAMPGWDQTGGSALSGVLGSMGINIPKPHSVSNGANISAGPNIVAGQPPGPFGPPTGPPPGPVSIDNSINVSSDVSDTKVLAPVKEIQNSNNSSAFQYQGGLPG